MISYSCRQHFFSKKTALYGIFLVEKKEPEEYQMEPIFTEDQLKNMNREALIDLMQVMQEQQRKTETKMKLIEEKQKELEFLNAMLSDRLTLAKKQRFGASSEKYADGYEQMDLFNEAEVNADMDTAEIEEEIVIPSHKRKKRTGKKE